ncbi:MAG: hypothetical protein MRJ96_15855 [Nitrospirales bacterium]|nr:hypothetical protein [Nitrospira sp.]MDR4502919.1 hypothetical protein [Nitrospirales bacterium]
MLKQILFEALPARVKRQKAVKPLLTSSVSPVPQDPHSGKTRQLSSTLTDRLKPVLPSNSLESLQQALNKIPLKRNT